VRNALDRARRSVTAEWRLKAALSVALTLFFCVPYFTLQRLPVLPARQLTPGWIDEAVGFIPAWVWVYQSVYLLMSVVPWLAASAGDLRRYARGFMLQSSIGFAFFLLVPIEGPRPAVVPSDVMFRLLLSYDGTLNSFPSLHVGLSAYTVLFAARISRGRLPPAARLRALVLLSVWAAAIAFAALATKQHYAIDLPAGAILAWFCHRWTWRRTPLAPSVDPWPPAAWFERSIHAETIRSRSVVASLDPGPQPAGGSFATSGCGAGAAAGAGGDRQPAGRGGPRVAAGTQSDLRAGHS
jgi:membrane-associated phospholipid phosphatase